MCLGFCTKMIFVVQCAEGFVLFKLILYYNTTIMFTHDIK